MNKKILVIKIGSSGISHKENGPLLERMKVVLGDIKFLKEKGWQVVLVTSGAINCAKKILPQEKFEYEALTLQQARASVGQLMLMEAYAQVAKELGLTIAQILVTHEDFKHRTRFINVRNTLQLLLEKNIIPIINENDTVSTKEISVGDNDQLAAMTSEAIDAQTLLLLTESLGLFDRDPNDPKAKFFKEVQFGEELSQISFGKKTSAGRGGMSTKLAAINHLAELGIDVILSTHLGPKPIIRAMEREVGTYFHANPEIKRKSRKSWIASVVKPNSSIEIDEGAAAALAKNSSLLPVGIKKVDGPFKRGDVIAIKFDAKMIAFGICEFDSADLNKIKGMKSKQLETVLDHVYHNVAVHKDNLYLKELSKKTT
ncbi:MAG: glutamate 5-kinase [Bacteriovoracaceae bacterium]|nr:glutamate 5-kinase [Bacteriovoracaceae bacterium]